MDLTLGSGDGLDVQGCRRVGNLAAEAAGQMLNGTDFWVLLTRLMGAGFLVAPSPRTPGPSLGFKGSEGCFVRC